MIPLAKATRWAQQIVSELAPDCERIEIAGSIRRGRPMVNDIDLVILPRNLEAVRNRALRNAEPVQNGPENLLIRLPGNGLQIDIFFARPASKTLFEDIPTNWGSILLCRTGSKEHNIWLCQRAQSLSLKYSPPKGLVDEEGYVVACANEEEIYTALKLPFIDPVNREISWLRTNVPLPSNLVSSPIFRPPKLPNPDPPKSADAFSNFQAWKKSTFGAE